jgi:hypothetical protein
VPTASSSRLKIFLHGAPRTSLLSFYFNFEHVVLSDSALAANIRNPAVPVLIALL